MDITDKNNKLISKLMMPLNKATKKIVKAIRKRKKRLVIGFDGCSMGAFSRLLPKATPSIITGVLKASKLKMFQEVFDYEDAK